MQVHHNTADARTLAAIGYGLALATVSATAIAAFLVASETQTFQGFTPSAQQQAALAPLQR